MNNDFETNGYIILKNIVDDKKIKDINDYLYLEHKKNRSSYGDNQIPENNYSFTKDLYIERTQTEVREKIEKILGIRLYNTYNWSRIYLNKCVLEKHVDRKACEISITLHISGDPWSIWVESNGKDVEIKLNPGDALLYKGCEVTHWRNEFEGKEHVQTFFHYVNRDGPYAWARNDLYKSDPNEY